MENKNPNPWPWLIGGALTLLAIDSIGRESPKRSLRRIGNAEAKDTVIYALYYRNKIVYIGVTNRLDLRIMQHEAKNWKFTEYNTLTGKMTRSKALKLEKRLIQHYCPKYNIHHNIFA